MRSSRLALIGGALALSLLVSPALAAGIAPGATSLHARGAVTPAFHGHSPRTQSFYCYPRNYWWFYRPYTTAAQGYARCMPYFHYPPQAYRGRRDPNGVK